MTRFEFGHKVDDFLNLLAIIIPVIAIMAVIVYEENRKGDFHAEFVKRETATQEMLADIETRS